MLKANDLINSISDDLARVETAIRNRGLLQRLDLHKAAETFFSGLLNLVYGYNLKNLNFVKTNHPAIDLGDETNSLGIQITAQSDKSKIQGTLDAAFKHKIYKRFDHLKVFIVGEKAGSYTSVSVPVEITFDPKKDVFDVRDVLKQLEGHDSVKLAEVAEYLGAELAPLTERLLATGPTSQSHDRDMFYEADLCLDEQTLTNFLDELAAHHFYCMDEGGREMWNFIHHFQAEGKRYISEELNEEADKLAIAISLLMNFLAVNCFHLRGQYSKYLYLRPDWNEDRGGDGSTKQYEKYTVAEGEMFALIGPVREAYRSYRRKIKTTLAV